VIGARVLVVEDDRTIADEVRAELVAHGYEVSLASTGRGGLDLARTVRPDLVLLDLGLPDLDGVQLCRTLRAELPTVPIVIVTARDTDVDVVVGLDAGATDYVTKPFSTAVLLARVRAHLRGEGNNGRDGDIGRSSPRSSSTCGPRSSPSSSPWSRRPARC
jgi:DNA-binding response OmpR family regulator